MPRRCSVCKIECEKALQCSKCHGTIYCSVACQKADWKQHKRSDCAKPASFHKLDREMKKYTRPNYPLGYAIEIQNEMWEERRRNPEEPTHCDSCMRRFRGIPITEDEYDFVMGVLEGDAGDLLKCREGEYDYIAAHLKEDAGDVFKRCAECDYMICEDCSKPENQGIAFFDRPRGTCRCHTANFGVSYCISGPSYLDGDGAKPYHGDRHPPIAGSGYDENAYESKERRCKTCGVIARCLKKEHLKDVMPGMK